MIATIHPGKAAGSIPAPPSKSMAHRLLICAGLAQGESLLRGISYSEDILATIDCLRALGATVTEITSAGEQTAADGASPCGTDENPGRVPVTETQHTLRVRGADPRANAARSLHCRESGSTLRFFVPLCALSAQPSALYGAESLLARPMQVYETIFRERGLFFEKERDVLRVCGALTPGTYTIDGSISSQFVSGLLFALPLLAGESFLRLLPPVESASYIDMTVAALDAFGVHVTRTDDTAFRIPAGCRYQPADLSVEGDWSNAAFFLALGVRVNGLLPDSLQGDKIFADYLRALDAGTPELDISDCPDLGPVLFSCAALQNGGVFTGTRRLRIKESDRGAAMAAELQKCGVPVQIGENRITVGCGVQPPAMPLDGHNDHRIVMALSVLCAQTGGVIEGAEAVAKSFPDFFDRLRDVGIRVETA